MAYFEVSGVSQKTGKPIKPKIIEAMDDARAGADAEANGMSVLSITRLPDGDPTEKQIAYAKDLGITIPTGANRKEVSDLISNAVDRDEPADPALLAYADKLNIVFTDYTGEKELHGRIWHALPSDSKTKVAWFTYCLYRDLLPRRVSPVATSHEHPSIQAVAEKIVRDAGILESISRYEGQNLAFFGERTSKSGSLQQGGSIRTKAYKAVSEWLKADPSLGMPSPSENQPPPLRGNGPSKSPSGNAVRKSVDKAGCMVVVAMLGAVASTCIAGLMSLVLSMVR